MTNKKKSANKLTPGEMEIMSLLWQCQELTLSEAHTAMKKLLGREIGYTTMQTRLNRLAEKGVVTRSSERPAKYRAAISPESVSSNQLNVLLERVTQGQVVPLVANLVNDRSLSREEIVELKKLIVAAEKRLDNDGEPEA